MSAPLPPAGNFDNRITPTGRGGSIGWGGSPATGPLPGESYESYQRRLYELQRYEEQQAEQRAYQQWLQAEGPAYNDMQQADNRAYGEYLNADARLYGQFQNADARAYNEARQTQSDMERIAQNNANLVGQRAQNQIAAGRNQVNLADRYATAAARGRQQMGGGIAQRYKQSLGGY
jgi:hypothetical protein